MKNILVPIDFSTVTERVLEQARELAKAFGAQIHIVHVREVPPQLPTSPLGYGALGMPEMVPGPVPQVIAQPIEPNESEKRRLEEWKAEMERAGLEAKLHEPLGNVVDEILECARTLKIDGIVMGRHGHGAMYNLLVGSVTEGVLKRAKCPVVLVPVGEPPKS